jgi:predicted nucleic acid-binding protein
MPVDAFFDTNVLIYSISDLDARSSRAESLLAAGGVVGVQALNEFVSVARRKFGMPWEDVAEALDAILVLCPSPIPLTLEIHRSAVKIAQNYGYGIYDALVLAAALAAKCTTLYSEDFQDGQLIEGRLIIRNPFAGRV